MVFLNEWLPNPTGSDTKGEFIELWNGGSSPVNLNGWILQADGKKKFRLFGTIKADGYLLLPRSETKLSLKNTDGKLVLFDAAGRLADQPAFEGSAPEGKSFNRVSYDSYDGSSIYNTIQQFAWGAPTPGAKNGITLAAGISDVQYPVGVPLNEYRLGLVSVLGFAVLAGVIFAAILWYAMRHDEGISQLFLGRDEAIRP
ncbi:MAG: lamin tail domain-containing protein [Minisyncoccia bacterium]